VIPVGQRRHAGGVGSECMPGHGDPIGRVGWNQGSPKRACDGSGLEWKKVTAGGATGWSRLWSSGGGDPMRVLEA
jgi:hypothetical protein